MLRNIITVVEVFGRWPGPEKGPQASVRTWPFTGLFYCADRMSETTKG